MILVGIVLLTFIVFFVSNNGFSFYKSKINEQVEKANQSEWIEKCKSLVSNKLKDPDSAKFKDLKYSISLKSGKSPIVTGYLNSKNSFGGYTGYQRFICGGTMSATYLESEVEDFEEIWSDYR